MLTPSLYPSALKRRREKRRRLVAVALAATVLFGIFVPNAVSVQPHAIVTGHSTFFNGDAHDPCLAAVVGIMRYKVLWFNDMTLVERYNGDGTYLYITENGTTNPTNLQSNVLVSSGVFYDFVDPNGHEWHVQEAYWEEKFDPQFGGGVPIEPGVPPTVNPGASVTVRTERYYTWIVAVDKPHRDNFAGGDKHDWYNFVTLVNTCKFNPREVQRSQEDNRTVTHNESYNSPKNGHEKYMGNHTHEKYTVNLWVGGPPAILPAGTETPNYVTGVLGMNSTGDVTYDPDSGTYQPNQPGGGDG